MRFLCSIYRALLLAYPPEFREQYGGEMQRVFRDRCRDEWHRRGFSALMRALGQVGQDWLKSVFEERIDSMRINSILAMRFALLAAVGLNLAILLFSIRPHATQPVLSVIATPFVLLWMYGLLVFWATSGTNSSQQITLHRATRLGLISGGVLAVYTLIGTFIHLGESKAIIPGVSVLVIVFSLWSAAGYFAGSAASGMRAGCWSALICVLIKVTLICLMLFASVMRPEFVGSSPFIPHGGWTDMHAWFEYTTLTGTGQHLILGPTLGLVFGLLGGVAARIGVPSAIWRT